jgi:hypothetical protein
LTVAVTPLTLFSFGLDSGGACGADHAPDHELDLGDLGAAVASMLDKVLQAHPIKA